MNNFDDDFKSIFQENATTIRRTIGLMVLVWIIGVIISIGLASALIYALVQWGSHLKIPA